MLDGEESRPGLKQLVDQAMHKRENGYHVDDLKLSQQEAHRHSYQRSAKGNVSIKEVSPDGDFIILNNTHRSKEEKIGDWKLRRKIDGGDEVVYSFSKKFVLRPNKSVIVYARGKGANLPPEQIETEIPSFGAGISAQTCLYNKEGEVSYLFVMV